MADVATPGRRLIGRYGAVVWLAILGVLGAIFVAHSRGELAGVLPTLRHADVRWLAVALACQIAVETLVAQKFRVLLRRLGHRVGRTTITRSHLYRHVIATIVPFGGPPAIVGFARDLGPAGVPAEDALYATMLSSIASEFAFLLVLLPTIGWLLLLNRVSWLVVAGAGFLMAMLAVSISGLFLAHRISVVSPAFGRRLPRRVREALLKVRRHGLRPRDLIVPVALAFGVNLCGIVMMEASLRAVSQHPALSTVLAARVLASVVMLLAPVYQGAGVVEFTAVGVLTRGGVPAAAALAATVLFRVFQFWLPLSFGVLSRLGVRVPVPSRRWLKTAGAGAAIGLAVVAIAEIVASHRMEHETDLGSLDRTHLLGLSAGLFIFLVGSQLRRLQPLAVRARSTDGRE